MNSAEPAPVALFAYDRLSHLRQTVEALRGNNLAAETQLRVFCDGPKDSGDAAKVAQVREYISRIEGFKSVRVVQCERNFGLAQSIIAGVTEVVEDFGKVIVLEDDLVASPFFLTYMNDALNLYEADERVVGIHGYIYPVGGHLPETFFLRGADCWGWATWNRGWRIFESDAERLLGELRRNRLEYAFDFEGAYPYTKMLKDCIAGENDSWAVRWYASAFLRQKLTLYPGRSLIRNIGLDYSGTHSGKTDKFDVVLSVEPIRVTRIPIEEDESALRLVGGFLRSLRPTLTQRFIHGVRSLTEPLRMK
jgi:hypothetical protein